MATRYVYDQLGRTTTLPKRDTSQAGVSGAGDASIEYTATDTVASIQQTVPAGVVEVRRQAFSLDASGRISTTTSHTGATMTGQSRNHYDGNDDSPAWTETRPNADTDWADWTRYLTGLAGGLGLTVTNTGAVELQLANPHGDIVATATLGTTGLAGYHETDEYGQPADPTVAQSRYGWLGAYQRDTGTTLAGLTLMGARLYNPATGRFLSIDPIPGGNDNRYTYPADPVNDTDLDGLVRTLDAGGGGGGPVGGSIPRVGAAPAARSGRVGSASQSGGRSSARPTDGRIVNGETAATTKGRSAHTSWEYPKGIHQGVPAPEP